MPDASPQAELFHRWAPAFTVIAAIITAVSFIGGTLDQVRTNTDDIKTMKARQDQSDSERRDQRDKLTEKLNTIGERTARIESTLQALTDEQRRSALR